MIIESWFRPFDLTGAGVGVSAADQRPGRPQPAAALLPGRQGRVQRRRRAARLDARAAHPSQRQPAAPPPGRRGRAPVLPPRIADPRGGTGNTGPPARTVSAHRATSTSRNCSVSTRVDCVTTIFSIFLVVVVFCPQDEVTALRHRLEDTLLLTGRKNSCVVEEKSSSASSTGSSHEVSRFHYVRSKDLTRSPSCPRLTSFLSLTPRLSSRSLLRDPPTPNNNNSNNNNRD